MSISIDVPSVPQDDSADLHFVLNGATDTRNKKKVAAVVLVDPVTGLPMPPSAITFTSLSLSNGADVAQGSTTDASSDPTVIGLLKAIKEQTLAAPVATQTAQYSTTGPGATINVTDEPVLAFSIQVSSVTTGTAATSWTVNLEGSLDGAHWATLRAHVKPTDAESVIRQTIGTPVLYLRANVAALNLGATATAITVSILGKS